MRTDQLDLGLGPLSGYRRISYTTLNALSAIRRNLVNPAFDASSRIALCGSRRVPCGARRARCRVAVVAPGAPGVAPQPVSAAAGGYWMFWWVRKTPCGSQSALTVASRSMLVP